MLRAIVAVLLGYVVFSVSAVLLFQLSGVDPHAPTDASFLIFGTLYGVVFALISGVLVGAIAPLKHAVRCALGLSSLMAISGLVSLVARPGEGAIWSQLAMVLLFAPAALAAAVWVKRHRSRSPIEDAFARI